MSSKLPILAFVLFLPPMSSSSVDTPEKPHIVIIVADDLRFFRMLILSRKGFNDVSFHGSSQIPTPNIDALAYTGRILNNYYVQPLCSPSRSALMTGFYPIHTGLYHGVINADEPYGLPLKFKILPEYLKDLSYRRHMVGKWHLGFHRHEFTPTFRGFETYFGPRTGNLDYWKHIHYLRVKRKKDNMWGFDMFHNTTASWSTVSQYATRLYTEKAEEIIEKHNKSEPLFLYFAHTGVHSATHDPPLEAPEETVRKFLHIKDTKRRTYAAMVSEVDQSVGRVVAALKEKRMLDNSMILFTTDNGGPAHGFNRNQASNWPLRGVKSQLWEGGVRGAALLWSPRLKSSGVSRDLLHITDWLPTLYAAAGGDPSTLQDVDGKNQWPTLALGKPSARKEVLLNIEGKNHALRMGKYKLIRGVLWPESENLSEKKFVKRSKSCPEIRGAAATRIETSCQLDEEPVMEDPVHDGPFSCSAKSSNKWVSNLTECVVCFEQDFPLKTLGEIPDHLINPGPLDDCGARPPKPTCPQNLQPCLFDVESDPCEYHNLVASKPNILAKLEARLKEYAATVVPDLKVPSDPMANPAKWEFIWACWKDFPGPIDNSSSFPYLWRRRIIMNPSLFVAVLCSFFSFCAGFGSSPRPHIIFILADDLGFNDVSFHGSTQIPTPNIDALAFTGKVLNNYYVQPICSPSRGALMTGYYPIHTGLQHLVICAECPYGLPLEYKLLPEYLRDLGYRTHAVGKWHLGFFQREYLPTSRGFESHFGQWTGSIDYYRHFHFSKLGVCRSNQFREESFLNFTGFDMHEGEEPNLEAVSTYITDVYSSVAEGIIAAHDVQEPLFLYVPHVAVHSAYDPEALQAPPEVVEQFSYIEDIQRRYFAAMTWKLDEAVGKIVEALRVKDMLQNSIIVFSTDNGGPAHGFGSNQASNWPLRGVKVQLWEGGVRGAGVIWSPLLQNSGVSQDMIHITDWLPTLYSAAGGDVSTIGAIDGVDQWATLSQDKGGSRSEVLLNIDNRIGSYALRIGPYKLVYGMARQKYSLRSWASFRPEVMLRAPLKDCGPRPDVPTCPQESSHPCLFDVEADPCEYHNLAEEKPEIVNELLARLAEYNATAVPPVNQPPDPAADPALWGGFWTNWGDYTKL
ncbi:unnamed protein product [Cyprideis torosa]|uniref:Uncharacterized protein n=1 Tax=Cyprideis torosa TaxID=163714 RepID=A0A7R8W572_9CRUS|nr:unnamed protein product [Cyprideis torosa]CAG0883947.1 unnamed protein product [Cyprideis torosa]